MAPLALQLAEWVVNVESARAAEPKLAVAGESLKWVPDNASELRNERIAPLANQARGIWSTVPAYASAAGVLRDPGINLGGLHVAMLRASRGSARRLRSQSRKSPDGKCGSHGLTRRG